jgi:hypothetical protein
MNGKPSEMLSLCRKGIATGEKVTKRGIANFE